MSKVKRATVFVHYDQDNIVDNYVYYYVTELKSISSKLIFVTVSDIPKSDIEKLKKLGCQVCKRENIGYDFYSYKVGIEHLNLNEYDELIIANDSVFGPLTPLKIIIEENENIPLNLEKIEACIIDYGNVIKNFKPYTQTIQKEHEKFIRDIKKVFLNTEDSR